TTKTRRPTKNAKKASGFVVAFPIWLDLLHTVERQTACQRLVACAHRVWRRTENQRAVLETEEALLLDTHVIRAPCRLDLQRHAPFGCVDRAWAGIGDVRAVERSFHLFHDRRAAS